MIEGGFRVWVGAVGVVIFSFLMTSASILANAQESCWTDAEVLASSPNPSRAHQLEPWPAHRIIDNVYYVGTRNLGSFVIETSDGLILINSNYHETLPLLRRSVEDLGSGARTSGLCSAVMRTQITCRPIRPCESRRVPRSW